MPRSSSPDCSVNTTYPTYCPRLHSRPTRPYRSLSRQRSIWRRFFQGKARNSPIRSRGRVFVHINLCLFDLASRRDTNVRLGLTLLSVKPSHCSRLSYSSCHRCGTCTSPSRRSRYRRPSRRALQGQVQRAVELHEVQLSRTRTHSCHRSRAFHLTGAASRW